MANLLVYNILYKRVAINYNKLRKVISKLHKTSSSIAFIKEALYNNITPTFAKIKGQFLNNKTVKDSEQTLMKNHMNSHYNKLKDLKYEYNFLKSKISSKIGKVFTTVLIRSIERSLQNERIESFKVKNKKIAVLISQQKKEKTTSYSVPIINLSNYDLSVTEYNYLKFGLCHSFLNKDKHTKKNIAANMEKLAYLSSKKVDNLQLEDYYEFLRGYTDIFTNNLFSTEDHTYHQLKDLIRNKDIVILKGDKDSSIVIMNKSDYINKLEEMITEGIEKGVYEISEDNTLQDLKRFQDFLYRNFKTYEHYDKMYPSSNSPAKLYGTAKTHKFQNIEDFSMENIKFHPIIYQTGTYTYGAAQVISDYLKPLCSNQYSIKDTQSFAKLIKDLPPLNDDEEDVSYDVESLFTNIPIDETIEYILDQIYNKEKLKPLCSKLIFKRLLQKLATEVTFTINGKYCRQKDGCTISGPLSVTLSDIFMNFAMQF